MPVYNEAPFVREAVESVLNQTFSDLELLVVDDGSTDRSLDIVAAIGDPRIRIVENPANTGLTASLNRGLAMIQSQYVARLDANDLSAPRRLEKQVAFLDAHPDVAVVGSQATAIDAHGRRIRRAEWWRREWLHPVGDVFTAWYRMFDTPLFHSAATFRLSVIRDELGGYDERYLLHEDAELWMRIAQRARIANVDERLISYRIVPGSLTANRRPEGFRDRKIAMLLAIMRDVLRWPDAPGELAEAWVDTKDPHRQVPPAALRELDHAVDACATRFRAIFPAAAGDRRIYRHHASIVARLLEKAVMTDRLLACQLFAKMLRLDALSALLFLPRFLVFLVVRPTVSP